MTKSTDISQDLPIKSVKEDLFSRGELARRCASILQEVHSDNAFVIGLSGPWGSGKTSFVNMVREYLDQQDDAPLIINFNAWLYSSQEQLVKQFFSELGRAIRSDSGEERLGTISSRVGSMLTDYADIVSAAGVDALAVVFPALLAVNTAAPLAKVAEKRVAKRALQMAGSALKRVDKTAEQLRDEIAELLKPCKSNIVVIIDDVDRLPGEEIRALFKLVNLVASFPHMTFLLAYDRGVVTRALAEVQGIDGEAYLEKIVQLPIDLPPASKDILRKLVSDVLEPFINASGLNLYDASERRRLVGVFDDLVMRRIETPRQAKRYLNMFNMVSAGLGKEICPTDVIGMTAVMLFYPNVSRWIWNNRDDICTSSQRTFNFGESRNSYLKESLSAVLDDEADDAVLLSDSLRLLFPKLHSIAQKGQGASSSVSRETGRVAHIDNLELLYGTVGQPTVSREHLHHLVFEADESELETELDRIDYQGDLKRFVESAKLSIPNLSVMRKESISCALFGVFGRLRREEQRSFLSLTAVELAARLEIDLMRGLGTEKADAIVLEATASYSNEDYVGLSEFLEEECAAHAGSDSRENCLSEDTYSRLTNAYVTAIVEEFPRIVRMDDFSGKFLWRHIDAALGRDALEKIRSLYGDDQQTRVLCAASALARWTGADGIGYGRSHDRPERYEPVFDDPDADEVEEVGKSAEFCGLPEELRLRVASLYYLLSGGESQLESAGEHKVPLYKAEEIVRRWESESVSGYE